MRVMRAPPSATPASGRERAPAGARRPRLAAARDRRAPTGSRPGPAPRGRLAARSRPGARSRLTGRVDRKLPARSSRAMASAVRASADRRGAASPRAGARRATAPPATPARGAPVARSAGACGHGRTGRRGPGSLVRPASRTSSQQRRRLALDARVGVGEVVGGQALAVARRPPSGGSRDRRRPGRRAPGRIGSASVRPANIASRMPCPVTGSLKCPASPPAPSRGPRRRGRRRASRRCSGASSPAGRRRPARARPGCSRSLRRQ